MTLWSLVWWTYLHIKQVLLGYLWLYVIWVAELGGSWLVTVRGTELLVAHYLYLAVESQAILELDGGPSGYTHIARVQRLEGSRLLQWVSWLLVQTVINLLTSDVTLSPNVFLWWISLHLLLRLMPNPLAESIATHDLGKTLETLGQRHDTAVLDWSPQLVHLDMLVNVAVLL